MLLEQIGDAGQARLAASKVIIVGIGGLGCQVAAQLAGAGVGKLILIDHDVVEESNLHRQILFREADIGTPKALAGQRELAAINSGIEIIARQIRVGVENVGTLTSGVNLVVDAADNFATSYLLSDACLQSGTPLLSASVNRSFGYVGIFCGTHKSPAPSYRALFPKLPGQQLDCNTVGVTGPAVGMIASLQAQEALKVLIDDEHQLLGKLLYADLWQYRLHTVNFQQAPEPEAAQVTLISTQQITADDFVIDVRGADEISVSPQSVAVQIEIPLPELAARILELPPSKRLVCVCQSGQRALIAAQQLIDFGHGSVAALLPDNIS